MLPLGVGMAVLGSSLRDNTDPITREEISGLDHADVNRFDRAATENWSPAWDGRSDEYRDWVVRAAFLLTGVEGVSALAHGRLAEAATLGVMFGELFLVTAGVTYMTKAIVGRKRPYVFNPDMSVDERFHIASSDGNEVFFSFFSGHAAAAFAAASFTSTLFMDIHGTSVWSHVVWGSTLTFAALAGTSRVKAGVHYPSDVIVGAMVGSAIGHLVPRLHRKTADNRVSLSVSQNSVGVRLRF
jgi:membrane-associated phospholipid phosphatase